MLRISVLFMIVLGFAAVLNYGCSKEETGRPQVSGEMTEQDFARIHRDIDMNRGGMDSYDSGMSMGSGGHGMSPHGKKDKPDPNKVIATVNNEKILRKDLDLILSRFKNHVNPVALASMEQQITEQLVAQSLLRQFVTEKNLIVQNEMVDKEIEKMRENIKNNPTTKGKTLEEFLELQGSNIDELRTAIRMSAAIENYVSSNINDKRLEEYFIKNITNFNDETVTASHILVDTKYAQTQEELDKAKAKIDSIKQELDAGADFAELAKKYSDCPTGKTGGALGSFPRHGVMVESFANAAFATEAGKISDPVKTEFGYHLIHVTAHTPPKDISFSEVKDRVREELIALEMNNLIKDLHEKAKIEITLQ
ncbi:MAG: peptidylprolyl isomerase [Candidatus Loosdrechtia sp.]|uniref:peptidylprolyl isomerase n=1 Tax=Candidatus Loosdrechtia sp. TaxID=3101272 RepID=UPI003A711974|nr:MAG: peptidylprolyl isomerase [Candidatus Jettenia sp. AMX2]